MSEEYATVWDPGGAVPAGSSESGGAPPDVPPNADAPDISDVMSIRDAAREAAQDIIRTITRDLVGSRSVSPTNELILALVDLPAINAYMKEMGRKI